MDVFYNILTFIGGLGAFLLSVRLISNAMQALVGNNLKQKLQKMSSNRFKGLCTGVVATIMLQSSTAMTVLVVSLINAGVLTFVQSFAIILGVNIGSGLIISTLLFGSIKIGTIFASFTGIGAFIVALARKEKTRQIGQALLAFGVLFLALNIMTDCMSFFNTVPGFDTFVGGLQSPIIMLLIGFVFCILVQSTLASNAVILTLCGGLGLAGVIDIQSALWMVIGVKMSPCISVLFASIGAQKGAKQAAWLYIVINAISALTFILLYFTGWTYWLVDVLKDPALIIVAYNIGMTLLGSMLLLPFNNSLAKIFERVFKKKGDVFEMDNATIHLAGSALVQYGMQAEQLIAKCNEAIHNVYSYIFGDNVLKREDLIREMDDIEEKSIVMANNVITSMGDLSEIDKKKLLYYHIIADRIKSLIHRTEKMLEVSYNHKPKENFGKRHLQKIEKLYEIVKELAGYSYTTIVKFNNEESIDKEMAKRIVFLDSELIQLKLDVRSGYSSDKKKVDSDAYIRIINELEQMGEQHSSISLAYYNSVNTGEV